MLLGAWTVGVLGIDEGVAIAKVFEFAPVDDVMEVFRVASGPIGLGVRFGWLVGRGVARGDDL